MLRRRLLCAFGITAAIAPGAFAQAWPTKPIRIVVPIPPGQATDILARVMADQLTRALGQQVVAENRPGAGGSIGADVVAKAKGGADLNYGSSGNGSASHLAVEMMKSAAGIKLTHVPFKGNADALMALQAGDIQVMSDAVPDAPGRSTPAR